MLVLKRKRGETFLIGGTICITVCGFRGSTVLLGISAPREIPILRAELSSDPSGSVQPEGQQTATED